VGRPTRARCCSVSLSSCRPQLVKLADRQVGIRRAGRHHLDDQMERGGFDAHSTIDSDYARRCRS